MMLAQDMFFCFHEYCVKWLLLKVSLSKDISFGKFSSFGYWWLSCFYASITRFYCNFQYIKSISIEIFAISVLPNVGNSIANGAFHMAKNESLLMWQTMKLATYETQTNTKWSAVGSTPLTSAMRMICGIKSTEFAAHHVTSKFKT